MTSGSPSGFESVEAAIADIRNGKMVILVDDEDRENEGDLVLAAERVTPDAIAFMARFGRGLICLTLTEEQVRRLELPMMTVPGRRGPPLGTAFTLSIEARHGVTTGISAADRARTIQVAASPSARAEDIVTPGHVFPLRARRGGVLVRAGQTEGSVDLARLAGLEPAGVICEIMNDDGTMARMPELRVFAAEHGLRILSVADLIAYRLRTERLVQRVVEATVRLHQTGTDWSAIGYEDLMSGQELVALVKRLPASSEAPVLARVHRGATLSDFIGGGGPSRFTLAIEKIEAAGCGVLVYLPGSTSLLEQLGRPSTAPPAADANAPFRDYGLGAQVLVDLGVRRLRLLTSSQRRLAGLAGFGIEVTEVVSLPKS